jgi:hypothetical protein
LPILNGQAGDAIEFGEIRRDQRQAARQSLSGDEQIVGADGQALNFKHCPHNRSSLRRSRIERSVAIDAWKVESFVRSAVGFAHFSTPVSSSYNVIDETAQSPGEVAASLGTTAGWPRSAAMQIEVSSR